MQIVSSTKQEYQSENKNVDSYKGLSKDASFWSIAYNSMIVRLLIWKRYGAEAVGSIVQIGILIAVFFLFATAVGFRGYTNFGTNKIFIFFLSGFLILVFDGVAIWSPVDAMNRELYNGTLEYLYFTPMKKYPYFFGYLLGSVITSSLTGFIPAFIVLIIYTHLPLFNIVMILFTLSLLMLSLMSFGIIVSLTVILFKQVQALVSLLGLTIEFFTGAFIPLFSLPTYVRPIAYLFPHTWAYELIRYYSFNGHWPLVLPLAINWLLIIGFTILYTIIAVVLQKIVIKHSKTKGLHIL